MNFLYFLLLIAGLLQLAFSWKGTVSNSYNSQTLAENAFVDIGLLVTVTTTEVNERLLISFMLSVEFPTALQSMRFMILRNGAQLATNQLRWVGAKYAGEIQPVTVSFIDIPGPINSYTIKLQAAGFGTIGNGLRIRQLAVMQFPPSVGANYYSTTGTINPPSTAMSMTTSATPSWTSDKVLLMANLDATNVTGQPDITMQFYRSGSPIGPASGYALGSLISTPLSFLDEPASATSLVYSLAMSRQLGSKAVISPFSTTRHISAMVIPAGISTSVTTTNILVVTSTTWAPLSGMSVTVTTLSANDKVLLIFNADHTAISSTVTTFRLTIFRNGGNMGEANNGLLSINAGPSSNAKRSPMMVFLDPPGLGTFIYQVYAMSSAGLEVQLGRGYLTTQFAAILITDGAPPSSPPTAQPSRAPTAITTLVPTAVPTPMGTDCTTYCTVNELTVFTVTYGLGLGYYRLPMYFKVTFYILAPTLSTSAAVRNNIFELIDGVYGSSLLSLSMTETIATQIKYNGIVVAEYAPILPSYYQSAFTYITISVGPTQLTVTSNTQGTFSYPITSVVDTTRTPYYMYASNSYQTTAGGQLYLMNIAPGNGVTSFSIPTFLRILPNFPPCSCCTKPHGCTHASAAAV
jgi:hypothetical protein